MQTFLYDMFQRIIIALQDCGGCQVTGMWFQETADPVASGSVSGVAEGTVDLKQTFTALLKRRKAGVTGGLSCMA